MFGKKKQHPSFDTDEEGHHYVPGRARGSSPFNRPIVTAGALNAECFRGKNGRIDWNAWYEARKKAGLSK